LHLEQCVAQRQTLCPGESRWRLATLLPVCKGFLGIRSLSGLWLLMRHLGTSYQRARTYFHSPDVEYEAKLAFVRKVVARHDPGRVAVLFEDELTYYNHASPAPDYAPLCQQPRAGLAIGGERSWRAVSAVDAFSGAVVWEQASKVSLPMFIRFLLKVRQAYPGEQTIYIILDNWPVHFHPEVLSALVEQEYPFPYLLPKAWAGVKPSGRHSGLQLPIQLVALPTYASWLNPTEKIWRTAKQQRLHNHSSANNFKELIKGVGDFLMGLEAPSRKTLSFTGLLNPNGIFAEAMREAGFCFDTS